MQRTTAATAAIAAIVLLAGCRGSFDASTDTGVPDEDAAVTDAGSNNIPTNNTSGNNQSNNTAGNNQSTGNNTVSDAGTPTDGATSMADVSEPPFDAGPCGNTSFGDDFTVTAVDGTAAQGSLHAAATPAGGAVIAWKSGSDVHVTHVDGGGTVVSDASVAGDEIYGLAAHAGGRAVMVSRGTDILALVIFDANGNVVSDQTIIGDVPHDVTNNEWFGPLIRVGDMTWTGSQWATYFAVQRLWDDGVAHYGDQLRLYEADGSSNSMVWGWGCSHSMDVSISHNGDRLGAVCSSDCYPTKGVHFNHRGGELWPDETGSNCAGQFGTTIGASVPMTGGFWLAFTATDDRDSHDVAIAWVEGTTPQAPIWLTSDATRDSALRAAASMDDLVVAWNAGGSNQFVVTDGATGDIVEGPTTVDAAALGGSSDFFTYANGDIGWAQAEGGQVGLARLRVCR